MNLWKRTKPNPKFFRKGDAQRFLAADGMVELLVVKSFDGIAVTPHAVLIVAGGAPIKFRNRRAAERAAHQIIASQSANGIPWPTAVRRWQEGRAKNLARSRNRARTRKRLGPSAHRGKTAAPVVRERRVVKAKVHPSLWPENAGTW